MNNKKRIQLTHSEDYYLKKLLNEVKIKELMTSPVVTVGINEKFSEVAKKIMHDRIRHVPIVNNDGQLAGLISQRDLYKIVSPRKSAEGDYFYDLEALNEYNISEVMIYDPFTLYADDTLAKAVLAMVDHSYGCIPIIDAGNKPIGIITRADILCVAAQILKE